MILHKQSLCKLLALPLFFGLKIASGITLLKLAAVYLPVAGFATFFQFLLLGALFNMVSVGGIQNGLIRQIAATRTSGQTRSTGNAALMIWTGSLVLFCVPAIFFRNSISELLIDSRDGSWAVPLVALATFLAGPGQILCGILTGQGQMDRSLLAQGTGLLAGTLSAIFFLLISQPYWAAIAFYTGMLLTGPIAWLLKGKYRLAAKLDLKPQLMEAKVLLRYSGAFVTVALFTGTALFGLRYVYQVYFDIEVLGYWMVAQRISDTSTQFIGLFMAQIFLPFYASAKNNSARHIIIIKSWLLVTTLMTILLLVFLAFSEIIVHIVLSDKYLPAISMILFYMLGDIFRVTVSLAMHAAFARGSLKRYLGIEITAVSLFAAIMLVLTLRNNEWAPIIGYVSGYGLAALTICVFAVGSILLKNRGNRYS